MTINQFSSGLESANFVLTSDPVHQAWNAIEKQKLINPNTEPSLFNEIQPENPTIIAFGTPPGSLQGQEALVSSSNLKEDNFAHFEFLCNKSNPNFSLNHAATELFKSQFHELLQLKEKLVENSKSKTPPLIIITGQSVGGSVATLFTLWLLQGLNLSKAKRTLCITFGSPLVGDEHLRQCVLQFSTWKSCFLHIVSDQDHTPKIFMSQNTTGAYKPFGTFLLCSASGCACSEDSDFISEQFVTTNSPSSQTQDPNLGFSYGQILEDLKRKALCNIFKSIEGQSHPLLASIITQLLAIGVVSQQQSQDTSNLVRKMKKHETMLLIRKKKNSDSDKKLHEMKIHMAYLEWYKKEARRLNLGCYDLYRKKGNQCDIKVQVYMTKLMNYWEDCVMEVENMPQEEGASLRSTWLMAGTSYRRMVEPLYIADYYGHNNGVNYLGEKNRRPRQFVLLEQWWMEAERASPSNAKAKRQSAWSRLNEDSCFWAHVEEALISCKVMKDKKSSIEEKESAEKKLIEFGRYVPHAIKNSTVSPDVFIEKSSFIRWRKEFLKIIEGSEYAKEFNKNIAEAMAYGNYSS